MSPLIELIQTLPKDVSLPFSIYTSVREQRILNMSLAKPTLVFVLSGLKEIVFKERQFFLSGTFVFLSDCNGINIRNIPTQEEYLALVIDFDYQDFTDLPVYSGTKNEYITGEISAPMEQFLMQYVQISLWAPPNIVALRKKEILMMLHFLGYHNVACMIEKEKIIYKVKNLLLSSLDQDLGVEEICNALAMSESTLRRKLKLENTTLQELKENLRLGMALHLLQTTKDSISLIAGKCGYHSQSRFTQYFKRRFGLTPTELRKTKEPIT